MKKPREGKGTKGLTVERGGGLGMRRTTTTHSVVQRGNGFRLDEKEAKRRKRSEKREKRLFTATDSS